MLHSPSLRSRSRRDERGVTLVTFALSLVAMCAVIGLILGGSLGYSSERDSQTASDSAALAATSKLRALQTGQAGVTAADVVQAAQDFAENNDSDPGNAVICEVVDADYALSQAESDVIGPCNDTTAADPYTHVKNANAAGIRLRSASTGDVPFGGVSGLSTIESDTVATATIQPLASGNSPFMMCSSSGGAAGHPVKVLTPSNEINPAAIYDPVADGPYFMLWGEDIKNGDRSCGATPGPWRGWVNNSDTPYQVPGWWEVDTGNKNGHLVPRLVIDEDGCDLPANSDIDAVNGCKIAVPLCTHSNNLNGNNIELYCVTYGLFELLAYDSPHANPPCHRDGDNANKVICGRFLGAAVATGGQGGTGQAGVNDVVLIKLVQ